MIAKVNPDWTFQEGTEITLEVDTVCIGTGMKPLIGLQHMAGCHIMNDRALGGWAPCHDRNMETTVPHIYVAGDSTGIEEANTAIEEGKLAGISIAESYSYISHEKAKEEKDAPGSGWQVFGKVLPERSEPQPRSIRSRNTIVLWEVKPHESS